MKFEVEIRDYEAADGEPVDAHTLEEYLRDMLDRREDGGIVIVTQK